MRRSDSIDDFLKSNEEVSINTIKKQYDAGLNEFTIENGCLFIGNTSGNRVKLGDIKVPHVFVRRDGIKFD